MAGAQSKLLSARRTSPPFLTATLWSALTIFRSPLRVLLEMYAWGHVGLKIFWRGILALAGWLNGKVPTPPRLRGWLPWRTLRRLHYTVGERCWEWGGGGGGEIIL